MCGEQSDILRAFASSPGSPPRVRGTELWTGSDLLCARITPACAGNRMCSQGASSVSWDHPRVCGEQSRAVSAQTRERGSPPRVRGTGGREHGSHVKTRITPACAGNRSLRGTGHALNGDHPRVCGEQLQWLSGWS